MSIDALDDFVGPQEAATRQKLLAGARKGDPNAIALLRQHYNCWLIPVATTASEAVPERKRRGRPFVAGPWRGFKRKDA